MNWWHKIFKQEKEATIISNTKHDSLLRLELDLKDAYTARVSGSTELSAKRKKELTETFRAFYKLTTKGLIIPNAKVIKVVKSSPAIGYYLSGYLDYKVSFGKCSLIITISPDGEIFASSVEGLSTRKVKETLAIFTSWLN